LLILYRWKFSYISNLHACIVENTFCSVLYTPWIVNALLKPYSYSERSQNAVYHPRSQHLAIVQTRPSPPMLGFVDKVFKHALIVLFLIYTLPGENTVL